MVDFDPILAEIVTETKYMEQLGFSVPELARNVALQASNQLVPPPGEEGLPEHLNHLVPSVTSFCYSRHHLVSDLLS